MYTIKELLDIASKCTPTSYNTAFNKYVVVNSEIKGENHFIHIVELGKKNNHLYEVILDLGDELTINSIISFMLDGSRIYRVGILADVSQLTNYELRKFIRALVDAYQVSHMELLEAGGGLREIKIGDVHKRIVIPFFSIVSRILGDTGESGEPFYPQIYFAVSESGPIFSYTEYQYQGPDAILMSPHRFGTFTSIDEFMESEYYLSDETKYPKFVLDQQRVCLSIVKKYTDQKVVREQELDIEKKVAKMLNNIKPTGYNTILNRFVILDVEHGRSHMNRKVYVADIKANPTRLYIINYFVIYGETDASVAIFEKDKEDKPKYISNTSYTNKRNDEIRKFVEAYDINAREYIIYGAHNARLGLAGYTLSGKQAHSGWFNPPAQCIENVLIKNHPADIKDASEWPVFVVSEDFDKITYTTYDPENGEEVEFKFETADEFKKSPFYLGNQDGVSPYVLAQQEFCLKEAIFFMATGGEK